MKQPSFREQLQGSADEQDWNDDSCIHVLLDFLDEVVKEDPLLHEKFQRYLDQRVSKENDELPGNEDEDDEDEG